MLVFGIDIPLIEIMVGLALIILLLLLEAIVIVALLSKHMAKMKILADLLEKLSKIFIEINTKELEVLYKIKK